MTDSEDAKSKEALKAAAIEWFAGLTADAGTEHAANRKAQLKTLESAPENVIEGIVALYLEERARGALDEPLWKGLAMPAAQKKPESKYAPPRKPEPKKLWTPELSLAGRGRKRKGKSEAGRG
jgi:hypothetical protein